MVNHYDIPVFKSKLEEKQYLAANRWPNGKIQCPVCSGYDITPAKDNLRYRCRACTKHKKTTLFTAVSGTALANYHVSLAVIMFISLEINKGADGLSLKSLAKRLKISVPTAYNICRRLCKLYTEGNSYLLGTFAPTTGARQSSKNHVEINWGQKLPAIVNQSKPYNDDLLIAGEAPLTINLSTPSLVNGIKELANDYFYDKDTDQLRYIKPYSNQAKRSIEALSEAESISMIKKILYPNGTIACPHCQGKNKYNHTWRGYHRCGDCKKKYNWKTNTYFMHNKLPIKKCLALMIKFYNARKSISSHEIGREEGISQKTAHRHMAKLRKCMFLSRIVQKEKMQGPVQYDEKIIHQIQVCRLSSGY